MLPVDTLVELLSLEGFLGVKTIKGDRLALVDGIAYRKGAWYFTSTYYGEFTSFIPLAEVQLITSLEFIVSDAGNGLKRYKLEQGGKVFYDSTASPV